MPTHHATSDNAYNTVIGVRRAGGGGGGGGAGGEVDLPEITGWSAVKY